jgi:Ca2+/Na+ antiporter
MYTWPFTVLVWYMYINNNNNNKRYHRNRETIDTSDTIIIIINVHVPDQYSERSCIHVSKVSIVSLFLYLLLLLLLMYMYQTNKRYHRNRETIDTSDPCIHDRSLYWSGTCTLIIIMIIKDIIETEKQSIPLTHVYMTVHCTGLVHVHVNGHVYMCQRYRLFLCFYIFYNYYY